MNKEETNALQLLTGKAKLDEVSVEELQQVINEHPYFSAAQLLLCKKMQQVAHPLLQHQLYKTALYFPHEQWLRYLMWEKTSDSHDNFNEQTEIADKNKTENEVNKNDDSVVSELQNVTDVSDENDNEHEANIVSKPVEELPFKNEQKQTGIINDKEVENIIILPAKTAFDQLPSYFDVQAEPEEAPLDEEELNQQNEPLPIEESNQKIASILSGQAEEFNKPVDENKEIKVEAEPLHAVDYFASQGIKLDEKKDDNTFDKKVHKFTDWLRQMKRINPQPVDLGTNSEEENFVANIAASSNQTKEIITESMAEVLVKQNKHEKAVEIYEKLSLLYPLKNAYFAAKIQRIKL